LYARHFLDAERHSQVARNLSDNDSGIVAPRVRGWRVGRIIVIPVYRSKANDWEFTPYQYLTVMRLSV